MGRPKKIVSDEVTESGVVGKRYVCNKYKELRIGRHIQFVNGLFITSDPELQQILDKADVSNQIVPG